MPPPGNQAAKGENKHQSDVSGETGLLDSNYQTTFSLVFEELSRGDLWQKIHESMAKSFAIGST